MACLWAPKAPRDEQRVAQKKSAPAAEPSTKVHEVATVPIAESAALNGQTQKAQVFAEPLLDPVLPAQPKTPVVKQVNSAGAAQAGQRPVSRCPFGHGSVGAYPFPGYVHGKNPQVCKNGCTPDPALGKYGFKDEAPLDSLRREALEYQDLYHRERGNSQAVKEARIKVILDQIEREGTYELTHDELEHGVRVSWRNAPKCANRKFWEDLRLVDRRKARTPEEMFQGCLDLLEVATLSCVSTANFLVFRAQTPGTTDGPRCWNSQLIRYCCYEMPDGTLLGDPAERAFTKMLIEELGWVPPPPEQRTMFDVLPVVLQTHPEERPKVFNLPPQYVARVPIVHPQIPAFEDLGLQWYAVPAVSNMEVTVGGLVFTAVPFNGWYCVTEIVRNFTDEGRFNLNEKIAKVLGFSTRSDSTMWVDKVVTELTVAVMFSFREAGMGMVSHHTMIKNFYGWYMKELQTRGYCPGNWKWIIPPVSASQSKCYLQLNKMTEYSLKPGLWYAPGWHHYKERLDTLTSDTDTRLPPPPQLSALQANGVAAVTTLAQGGKTKVLILYASTTGNTAQYAERVAGVLRGGASVDVYNMEDFEVDKFTEAIQASQILILMSSTYGPGAPPNQATKFITWIQKPESYACLKIKPFVVIGFGSSAYPRFCAAADTLQTHMLAAKAKSLMEPVKADEKGFEEMAVWDGLKELLTLSVKAKLLASAAQKKILTRLPIKESGNEVMPVWTPRYAIAVLGHPEGMVVPVDRRREKATVKATEQLMGPQGIKAGGQTKLIKLEVQTRRGIAKYLAGDEVAVFAANKDKDVEEFGAAAGITDLDALFLLQDLQAEDASSTAPVNYPLPNTFRNVLTHYLSPTAPLTYEIVCALLRYAPHDSLLAKLAKYSEFRNWDATMAPRFCDIFKLFPSLSGQVPLQAILELCPVIRPRHYSISSSCSATPKELHITVSQLKYQLPSGDERKGLCSTFLCEGQPGDTIYMAVVPIPGFRMPLNSAVPIIMVAAGTGIAPFKGFWQERMARVRLAGDQAREIMGPALIIYGCRDDGWDRFYAAEMEEAVSMGALSDVLVAYSRKKGAPKTYVQDMVRERNDKLGPLLDHPQCHIFVCGSSNMASEVSSAFRFLMGNARYSELVTAGRYHEDVFGMVVPKAEKGKDNTAAAAASVRLMANMKLAQLVQKTAGATPEMDVTARDEEGGTVLHHAVRNNRVDIVAYISSLPRTVLNSADLYGRTPLQEAELSNSPAMVAILKSVGAALVPVITENFYKLHAATMTGDLDTLRNLLENLHYSVNQQDHAGLTPMHIAAMRNDIPTIEYLLKHKPDLSIPNLKGMPPFQVALTLKRPEAAEVLRAAGAPVMAKVMISGSTGKEALGPQGASGSRDDLISPEDRELVQSSWALLMDDAHPGNINAALSQLGVGIFMALFEQFPKLLELFPFRDEDGRPIQSEMESHGVKVVGTLGECVNKMNNFESLAQFVYRIVDRHLNYGVELVHYDIVVDCLQNIVVHQLQAAGITADAAGDAWGRFLGVVKALAHQRYASLDANGAPPAEDEEVEAEEPAVETAE